MLTVFWNSEWPILEEDNLEEGRTVNSARYSDLLTNKLKPAIRTKRRGILSNKVLLLHDSAGPHTTKFAVETISRLVFEALEHAAYSPDLVPSDYHLFVPLKVTLRARRPPSDEEVLRMVHKWWRPQPKTFFLEGISKIVAHWTKCIEKERDCTEE
jgi:histone-lysine N-methyltransferase SETMAR